MDMNLFKTEHTEYYVSQEGAIYSKYKTDKPLRTEIHDGYNKVLYSVGTEEKRITKWYRVDYLVASTYLDNPHGFSFINHKDGNKLNDNVENLEWKQYCIEEPSRVIEGFNSKYIITSTGKVFNNFTGAEMKQKNTLGYKAVALRVFDGQKSIQRLLKIHRLVAEYFIPNPQKLPVVNHKDGNKENNVVENLEWCTVKENTIHALKNQLKRTLINKDNGQFIIDLIEEFHYNYADVSQLLNIDRHAIAAFYQSGYKTFGFATKNIHVAKHSKKKPLTDDFKNKYSDILCG